MNYLIIVATLIAFFCVVIYYLKKNNNSQFTKLEENNKENPNVYALDTRNDFPTVPPVNPNVYKSLIVNSVPVKDDDNQQIDNTNQLDYSGGTTQIIKIPLQFNEPYDEQLRSQEIMITPYNRVKYNTTNSC